MSTPPQPKDEIEETIEELAMALTHSEQGEYAKNEEFVRRKISQAILSSQSKLRERIEKKRLSNDNDRCEECTSNLIEHSRMCDEHIRNKFYNQGLDTALSLLPNKQEMK